MTLKNNYESEIYISDRVLTELRKLNKDKLTFSDVNLRLGQTLHYKKSDSKAIIRILRDNKLVKINKRGVMLL